MTSPARRSTRWRRRPTRRACCISRCRSAARPDSFRSPATPRSSAGPRAGPPRLVAAETAPPAPAGGPRGGRGGWEAGGAPPPIDDPALRHTVTRALTNYLAGSADNLRADLAPGANVSLPAWRLHLEEVRSLVAAPGGGAVLALVSARDERGAEWTLRYELDVTRAAGRPLIQAIEMDPTR